MSQPEPQKAETDVPMDIDEEVTKAKDLEYLEDHAFRCSELPAIAAIDASSIECEEDRLLAEELYLCLDRLREPNLAQASLELIRTRIQEATCTMTSVPKPLKYLRTRLTELIEFYESLDDDSIPYKPTCAIVISVIGMTIGPRGICLRYRILSEQMNDLAEWGHEYMKHLSAEISLCSQIPEYYNDLSRDFPDSILLLANMIVPYFLSHNCEADAVDLLSSLNIVGNIVEACDEHNYRRIALYLTTSALYLMYDDEGREFVKVALRVYLRFRQFSNALVCAFILRELKLVEQVMESTAQAALHGEVDVSYPLQIAFMISRHGWPTFQSVECLPEMSVKIEISPPEAIWLALTGGYKAPYFRSLAQELGILDPKVPEDVYKSHLVGPMTGFPDMVAEPASGKHLGDTLVNCLLNAGIQNDLLLGSDPIDYIFKETEYARLTTTASLAFINLWDIDKGMAELDKCMYSADNYVRAGALLGCGAVAANTPIEWDPVLAMLRAHIVPSQPTAAVANGRNKLKGDQLEQVGAILGVGIAYCGTGRKDVISMFLGFLEHSDCFEANVYCSLGLGMVGLGSGDSETVTSIVNWVLNLKESLTSDPLMRHVALGIALFYYRKGIKFAEPICETVRMFPGPLEKVCAALIMALSSAGNCDMTQIQYLVEMCTDESGEAKKDDGQPSSGGLNVAGAAILGTAIIIAHEEIGVDMSFRLYGQLLHIGSPAVKKCIPLALALISASNPKLNFMDTLLKFTHDIDHEVVLTSIVALGLIGAGTNNARIAAMLRQLVSFHRHSAPAILAIRLAQGLVHLGKGAMTLSPLQFDRQTICANSFVGLITFLVAMLEPKSIMHKRHWMVMLLALAAQPRYLITRLIKSSPAEEQLQTTDHAFSSEPTSVPVRVGQAVDVVGQAGQPRTITGFQTHQTPVLLAYGERAELAGANEQHYKVMSSFLEGVVMVREKKTV